MLVEHYVAASLINVYQYTTFTLAKSGFLTSVNLGSSATGGNIFIYSGTINAYNVTNNRFAVFLQRIVATAGAAFPTFHDWFHVNCKIELPAGTYTFGFYPTVAQNNIKMVASIDQTLEPKAF